MIRSVVANNLYYFKSQFKPQYLRYVIALIFNIDLLYRLLSILYVVIRLSLLLVKLLVIMSI